jgi:hypothetical protein
MVAIVAFEEHHWAVLIAAAPHAVQSLVMAGKQFVAVDLLQLVAVAIHQVGE